MKRTLLIISCALITMGVWAQQKLNLWYNHPAAFFEESMPLGNGKLGALVYGGYKNDTIYLNDITYWTGKPVDPNEGKGKAEWLPIIREALFDEDYSRADSLQHYLQGEQSASYQPLGTLNLINLNDDLVKNYRRDLNLDSALARVRYSQNGVDYVKEYFTSFKDSLIGIRITANQPGSINYSIALTSQTPHQIKVSNNQITMVAHATGDVKETIHACTILRLLPQGGTSYIKDSTLIVNNANELIIYLVNATSFNGFDKHPIKEGADYLENALNAAWHTNNFTYQQFKQRHIETYQRLFERCKLTLGNAKQISSMPTDRLLFEYSEGNGSLSDAEQRFVETLYFQFGRYLLLSCSQTPSVPANLQGLWSPHLFAPWRANYTMNINLEENYWPADAANLSETITPLIGFVKGLSITGQQTARNFYGINQGWCAAHNSDPWCKSTPVGEGKESPEWANWNLSGAWLVNSLWDHYLYSQNKELLSKTIYPLMEGAAQFCMQWLISNPKQPNELITAPSTSPENEYVTDKGYHGTTCYGGTADLAIIRELFENILQAQNIIGLKQDKRIVECLNRLHPYSIGREGDLNEWYYDWQDFDKHHRHQSHLIGLYPGMHLDRAAFAKKEMEIIEAAKQTLIQKGDESTGWSTGWRINLWARLKDGNHAYRIYRNLLKYVSPEGYKGKDALHRGGTYPNFFDAHPPFQIDGNFGGTAGVCEMLAQSRLDIENGKPIYRIILLPALPNVWKNGEIKGLKVRGGVTLNMKWKDGLIEQLSVSSVSKVKVELFYNNKLKRLKLKARRLILKK